ncbi:hypothetical protein BDA96_04G149500 [Sorghum bicolor]|uniref:Clp R domain-containing protein n=1 Tax=Sorghum bicolor TaxID=4558 RepID=A0A921R693_SORBI|nr:hypothetical protein BDA96_04G149500 [Sorghum bicolor]
MRAGAYTVHQSLTAEAAAVLKLSLGLARRRGHAQVTPLHVAYTLLGVSEPSSSPRLFTTTTPAYGGLLMRACARSRSQSQTHPAQCRALELCFNVALNRLPTGNAAGFGGSSPSTSFAASLLQQPSPTLSNALVAALKRAQANQRRGCVELQSQPSPPAPGPQPQSTSPSQQQPTMLTIKVELDQLIISILDDPSVSRVMREAGFSSAAVKTNLEEESAAMLLGLGSHHASSTPSSCSPAPPPPAAVVVVPPHFFLEPYGGFPAHASGSGALWAAPSLESKSPSPCPCNAEDVRAILEVMLTRRQGRSRANPVVVGDSASVAEASVADLMRRMERGDVPDELRGARVLRLHLSHVHVRLMTRADVDAWVADLRRSVGAATGTDNTGAGLVIYVGDMRWAVDSNDDDARGFSPAAHLAAELARLLGELRLRAASHGHGGRAWLVAAASYGTFMRCQRSSLEVTWDLQPVSVPAGAGGGLLDLELGPRAATASPADGKAAHPAQLPLLDLAPKQEDGVPMPTLCAECAKYYENEATVVRAKAAGTNLALTFFPGWPQADEPKTSHKDDLMELKRKWSRLCQLRVHSQRNQPTRPWHANATTSSNSSSNPGLCLSFEEAPTFHGTGSSSKTKHQDVKTTLSLVLESVETPDEFHPHKSKGMDEAMARPAAQELEATAAAKSSDMKSVPPWLSTCELLPPSSGDLKRKAESVRMPSESKRWMGGGGGLDLNLRADDDEEDGGGGIGSGSGSSEDELAPSDLTNDGEGGACGDVTDDSLDSHRHAAVTFGFDH